MARPAQAASPPKPPARTLRARPSPAQPRSARARPRPSPALARPGPQCGECAAWGGRRGLASGLRRTRRQRVPWFPRQPAVRLCPPRAGGPGDREAGDGRARGGGPRVPCGGRDLRASCARLPGSAGWPHRAADSSGVRRLPRGRGRARAHRGGGGETLLRGLGSPRGCEPSGDVLSHQHEVTRCSC